MKEMLWKQYGLHVSSTQKSAVGAGSDPYFVTCSEGKYVVKYPASSAINHPEAEPELCEYLLHQAVFSTKLLRWLENYVETLNAKLLTQ